MRPPLHKFVMVGFAALAILVTAAGCAKKVSPPPAAAGTEPSPTAESSAPAPTLTLSASPATIERGQTAMLRWSSSNASSVTIDGGIGTVEASGAREVSPMASTTYTARATGSGGTANAETRITVTPPTAVTAPPPRAISDSEFFTTYIKDIFYDYDSYDLREDARQILRDNARALAERQVLQLLVEGHCDERGSEKYNLALGDKRAGAAKEFLVGQGISAERLDTISLGEERPFAPGHDETAWSQNRRAHFAMR